MATPTSPGTPSKADMDLQFSFVESLKEVLGIKSRTTEAEKASLSISKQIITAVQNQNRELSDQKTISKQISKNKDLQNKAAKLADLYSKNLGRTQKDSYDIAKAALNTIEEQNAKREEELEKALKTGKLNKTNLKNIDKAIDHAERELAAKDKILGKKIVVRASKGYKQPETDYTINVTGVAIDYYYDRYVIIIIGREENKQKVAKFFIKPGFSIKILGSADLKPKDQYQVAKSKALVSPQQSATPTNTVTSDEEEPSTEPNTGAEQQPPTQPKV